MSDKKSFRRKFDVGNAMNLAKADMVDDMLEQLIEIDTSAIIPWMYRDRKSWEMGDINLLSESIKKNGQIEPIILVKQDSDFIGADPEAEYVLIAGYRRWTACNNAGIKVKAFIKKISVLEAASLLKAENDKVPVSDYSTGMYFSSLIDAKIGTQDEVRVAVGVTLSVFNNYLAFSQVDKTVWDAVGDLSKVSSRTAAYIRSILNKNKKNTELIISISHKIREGAGEQTIRKYFDKKIKKKSMIFNSDEGVKRFSFLDGKISFSQEIKSKVKMDKLLEDFNKLLTHHLESMSEE
jgi:ParB family chromosome partitioning protein